MFLGRFVGGLPGGAQWGQAEKAVLAVLVLVGDQVFVGDEGGGVAAARLVLVERRGCGLVAVVDLDLDWGSCI